MTNYELDELVGTKVRALYQRLKGRDLFDVYTALASGELDLDRVMTAYDRFKAGKGPEKGPKPLLIKSRVRLPAFEYHQHIPRQEYRITVRNDFLFTPLNQQDQSVGI
ncbi:MAG: nucleotidyl transferase AbiEii/AbiGii toxin family protein [Bacteroidales bacterium]|nr:nucleotidyl transferase AbiEii/AbiGii toxin family protein [Bacteroidales bacterium]